MKTFRTLMATLFTLGLLGFSLGGYAVPAASARPSSAATAKVYKLKVNGLACPYCAYGIEKTFQQTGKVKNTDVKLQKGQVVLHMKPGKHFSRKQIKQLVDDAGFSLNGVQSANGAGGEQ